MGCKQSLCSSVATKDDNDLQASASTDNAAEPENNKSQHLRNPTTDSVAADIRRRSWRMRQSSIGPFVVTTEDGEIEDHVTVLEGDDLIVSPESSPLLLERLPVLFEEDEEDSTSQASGRDSVHSISSNASSSSTSSPSSSSAASASSSSTNPTHADPIEMSDDWSSPKSGPGALRLTNSSTRRAAYQVRFIDGQNKKSMAKDVLATPDSGILEAGASVDVQVLLAVSGVREGEQAELTVRADRLLITSLWFNSDVDLDTCTLNELDEALNKLWKEKLGSSKRYRVRLALSEMQNVVNEVVVPLPSQFAAIEDNDTETKVSTAVVTNREEQNGSINVTKIPVDDEGGVLLLTSKDSLATKNLTASNKMQVSVFDQTLLKKQLEQKQMQHHDGSSIVSSTSQMSVTTSTVTLSGTTTARGRGKKHGISRIAARRKTAIASRGGALSSFSTSRRSVMSSTLSRTIADLPSSSSAAVVAAGATSAAAAAASSNAGSSSMMSRASRIFSRPSFKEQLANRFSYSSGFSSSGGSGSHLSDFNSLSGLYEEDEEEDEEESERSTEERETGNKSDTDVLSRSGSRLNTATSFLGLDSNSGSEVDRCSINDNNIDNSINDRNNRTMNDIDIADKIASALQGTEFTSRTLCFLEHASLIGEAARCGKWSHHCVLKMSPSNATSKKSFRRSRTAVEEEDVVTECLWVLEEGQQQDTRISPWTEDLTTKITGVAVKIPLNAQSQLSVCWARALDVLKMKNSSTNTTTGNTRQLIDDTTGYLSKKIAILTPPDHGYGIDTTMAMRSQAGSLCPGKLSQHAIGVHSAVAMLSLRRRLQMSCFLDPTRGSSLHNHMVHNNSNSSTSRNHNDNDDNDNDDDDANEIYDLPYLQCGANILRVHTDGGVRLVVVDDVVPTTKDGEMLFVEDRDGLDVWGPLIYSGLLKCCSGKNNNDNNSDNTHDNDNSFDNQNTQMNDLNAKINVLSTLSVIDAMELLTGYVCTRRETGTMSKSNRTWSRMLEAIADGDVLGVTMSSESNDVCPLGLVPSFTYGVLDVREVSVGGKTRKFMLLHNPHRPKDIREVSATSQFPHWLGRWSLYGNTVHETWERYPEAQAALLHVSRGCRRDSFWMDYEEVTSKTKKKEFITVVDSVFIVHIGASVGKIETFPQHDEKRNMSERKMSMSPPPRPSWSKSQSDGRRSTKTVRGSWTPASAGGSCDFSTWRDNPQFVCDAPNRTTRVLVEMRLLPNSDTDRSELKLPTGVSLYSFPARLDGRAVITPATYAGFAGSAGWNVGFSKVAHRSSITLELVLGPATGPVVLIPCTTIPGRLGQFQITVSYENTVPENNQNNEVIVSSPVLLTRAKTHNSGDSSVRSMVSTTESTGGWHVYEHRGAWIPNRTAGGCRVTREFGQNTCFVAKVSASSSSISTSILSDSNIGNVMAPELRGGDTCKAYAVVSFSRALVGGEREERGVAEGVGEAAATAAEKEAAVGMPLIAGCHCFSLPSADVTLNSTEKEVHNVDDDDNDDDEDQYSAAWIAQPLNHHNDIDSLHNATTVTERYATETFKTFGAKRMELSSAVHKENQQSSGTAAFVEFDVPLLTAASSLSGLVFVPCTQDSNVMGTYSMRVYSAVPLQWSSMSVETLENDIRHATVANKNSDIETNEEASIPIDEYGEIRGQWTLGVSNDEISACGGCRNYDTWLENPTFSIPVDIDTRLSLTMSSKFEYDRLLASQAPAAGMYILAGNRKVAEREGKWLLHSSPFVRSEQSTWEVDLKASPGTCYVLVVCTYVPKTLGTFVVQLQRKELSGFACST